jgi:hypothetical protein
MTLVFTPVHVISAHLEVLGQLLEIHEMLVITRFGGDREAKHSARCQTDLPNMSVDWC